MRARVEKVDVLVGPSQKMINSEIGSPDEMSDYINKHQSKQLMWQNYKTRLKPNIEALVRLEKQNDSEYTNKIGKTLREFVLETHIGALVDYIDDFDASVKQNARHCVLLNYYYRSSKDFQKNRRPGDFE